MRRATMLACLAALALTACAGQGDDTDDDSRRDDVPSVLVGDDLEYALDIPTPHVSIEPSPEPEPVPTASSVTTFSTANPDSVVGDGSPSSCDSKELEEAIERGGVVVFNCGSAPHTIMIDEPLVLCNTHNCDHPWEGGDPIQRLVVDGGGKITLKGDSNRGIFYANTCEESLGWLSANCQYETTPHVVFQNITFLDGNAQRSPRRVESVGGGGGGGAIAMRGGQLTVINATFINNTCMERHSDAGGGAIRVTSMIAPVRISGSTFEGNACANGGAVSALHATMQITDSVFTNNRATGSGASDGNGGNGGAIYFDGTADSVIIERSVISGNYAPEGGPGVFYVSNDRSGHLVIRDTSIVDNSGETFYTEPYRSIFYLGNGGIQTSGSTIE